MLYSIHSIRESLESVNKGGNEVVKAHIHETFLLDDPDISDNFDLAFNHGSIVPLKDKMAIKISGIEVGQESLKRSMPSNSIENPLFLAYEPDMLGRIQGSPMQHPNLN